MATKKVNYTPEQTAMLVDAYQMCDSQEERDKVVAHYAAEFGKASQSIRAKLVSEGVYVAKTYKTKKGEKPESKAAIVAGIASVLGVDQERVESLEKANKVALNLVRTTLVKAHEMLEQQEENS